MTQYNDDIPSKSGIFVWSMFGLMIMVIAVLVANAAGWLTYATFAPMNEAVRRNTYEQSRAFQEGTIRDLDNLRMAYVRADDAGKQAIADTARHRFADVPVRQLPQSLQAFAAQVGADQ